MKNKYLGIILIVAMFAGYTTYKSCQTSMNLADLSLIHIESVAGENDDVIDGGELPEGGITCNSGGSGKCYKGMVKSEYGAHCSCLLAARATQVEHVKKNV